MCYHYPVIMIKILPRNIAYSGPEVQWYFINICASRFPFALIYASRFPFAAICTLCFPFLVCLSFVRHVSCPVSFVRHVSHPASFVRYVTRPPTFLRRVFRFSFALICASRFSFFREVDIVFVVPWFTMSFVFLKFCVTPIRRSLFDVSCSQFTPIFFMLRFPFASPYTVFVYSFLLFKYS